MSFHAQYGSNQLSFGLNQPKNGLKIVKIARIELIWTDHGYPRADFAGDARAAAA
ncbi:hypothetical protein GCM10027288_56560 [Bordetella tumbae]